MNDLDDRIQKALSTEDRELLEKYSEPKLFVQIGRSFRGEVGVVMGMLIFWGIVAAVFMGFCVYYYVNTANPQTRDLCIAGFLTGAIMTGMIKLFFYQQLGQLNILREIKRLELQVSLLAEKRSD